MKEIIKSKAFGVIYSYYNRFQVITNRGKFKYVASWLKMVPSCILRVTVLLCSQKKL